MSTNVIKKTYKTIHNPLRQTSYQDSEKLKSRLLDIQFHQGKQSSVWFKKLNNSAGSFKLMIMNKGSAILKQNDSIAMIPENSILFLQSGIDLEMQLSRGDYSIYEITWDSAITIGLSRWISKTHLEDSEQHKVTFCQGDHPGLMDIYKKVIELSKNNDIDSEVVLLGYMHELVMNTCQSRNQIQLAIIPENAPLFIKRLLKQVKKNPTRNWSLKDAAAYVGYSSYHLSRSFRNIMDYGFPEFVDRCRIEVAIKYLCEGKSIEQIASFCGYCSAHVFRESLKKYTGFLPSELRGVNIY